MEADFISQEDLEELLAARLDPAVSIYLPMERRGAEVRGNAIRLKNALARVEEQLKGQGWRTPDVEGLLAAARQMLQDTPYWQHQREGLALFIGPDFQRDYRLPLDFEPQTVLNTRFYVKPLLPFFSEDGHYYILAASQGQVRLLRATRHTVEELPLGESIPESLEEALQWDDPEAHLNVHSVTAGAAGREAGRPEVTHHGHGGLEDASDYRLRRFLRKVSTGLQERLPGERAPLVLAAVDYLHPVFAEAHDSEDLALLEAGLYGNPEEMSPAELQTQTWELVAPAFQSQRDAAMERYHNAAQTERASVNLEAIVLGAVQGRVDTLFIARDEQQWGRYDADEHRVEQHAEQENGDEDLLDLAAVHTLANGGAVYAVSRDEAPGDSPIAALFRY